MKYITIKRIHNLQILNIKKLLIYIQVKTGNSLIIDKKLLQNMKQMNLNLIRELNVCKLKPHRHRILYYTNIL